MVEKETVINSYQNAKKQYAALGIDTEEALTKLNQINISLHCWQADDVAGFETPDAELGGGGIQVTGNYPWKAKTINELRSDIEKVMSLLPGKQDLICMQFMVILKARRE